MDTLKSLQVFREVVRCGSFTQAAERLDMSVAMASKHVRHLEQQLQARLLNRTSRKLSLTEIGSDYYQRCTQALDTLHDAAQLARAGSALPQGELRLTMPMWCATPRFARLLADFSATYPRVTLSLHLDSRHTDLVGQGMDLALRVTEEPQPNLIVRPLTPVRFDWVASPAYLAHAGTPDAPQQLARHHALLPDYVAMDIPMQARARSNNTLMLHQLALAGMGLAFLPEWTTADDLAAGRLRPVELLQGRTFMLYAAYMDRSYLSAKVRCLIDFLDARWQRD